MLSSRNNTEHAYHKEEQPLIVEDYQNQQTTDHETFEAIQQAQRKNEDNKRAHTVAQKPSQCLDILYKIACITMTTEYFVFKLIYVKSLYHSFRTSP